MKNWTWVLCFPIMFAGCDFVERVPIEMVTLNQAQPLGKEKALESTIRFDVGSIEVTSDKRDASIYSYDLEYDKSGFHPDVHYNTAVNGTEGRLYVNLQSTHKVGIHPQRYNNKLQLAFNNSIPLTLKVTAGVGEARLSLSELSISRIDFESGVGEAKISSYEPNAVPCEYIRIKSGVGRIEAVGLGNLDFRELEFEGGVGGANLDFTGEWKQSANIRIKVGVGGVNMRMPREVGVKVEAEQNFLSGLHLEGFNKQDSCYYSENYSRASIRVSINIATGIGGLRITWI
ncbi:MAG: hypothetical protein JXA73_24685 [Acidobacteria bacterium]|nr:hypothetical protein [Acidobacteriota bacterium]